MTRDINENILGDDAPTADEYTKEDLITELQRVAEEEEPNNYESIAADNLEAHEFINHSTTPYFAYYREFDSWNDALEAAGLEPHRSTKIYAFDVIDDMHNVAENVPDVYDEHRGYLTTDTYDQYGKHSSHTALKRFGSWKNAVKAAGLPTTPTRKREPDYTEDDIINALRTVADELGHPPSLNKYNEHRDPDNHPVGHTIMRRFDTWNNALETAELKPSNTTAIPRNNLIEELQRVADELGHSPTTREAEQHTTYSLSAYYNQFDTWSDALEAADLNEPTTQTTQSTKLSETDLINELQHLADELGKTPTARDMNNHGKYSKDPYYRVWDSWSDALESANITVQKNHRGT